MTIKERAIEYCKEQWDEPTTMRAYMDGAIEQKAIDDAQCVNKVLMGKGSSINYYEQGFHDAVERAKTAFGKTCGWLATYPSCESFYNELVENFMKNIDEIEDILKP